MEVCALLHALAVLLPGEIAPIPLYRMLVGFYKQFGLYEKEKNLDLVGNQIDKFVGRHYSHSGISTLSTMIALLRTNL
jgi:hypothetical protein